MESFIGGTTIVGSSTLRLSHFSILIVLSSKHTSIPESRLITIFGSFEKEVELRISFLFSNFTLVFGRSGRFLEFSLAMGVFSECQKSLAKIISNVKNFPISLQVIFAQLSTKNKEMMKICCSNYFLSQIFYRKQCTQSNIHKNCEKMVKEKLNYSNQPIWLYLLLKSMVSFQIQVTVLNMGVTLMSSTLT